MPDGPIERRQSVNDPFHVEEKASKFGPAGTGHNTTKLEGVDEEVVKDFYDFDWQDIFAIFLTEFIGTGFLAFTIALSAGQPLKTTALAIGFVLICLVYMGAHVSGAHYNPAVTLAVLIRQKVGKKQAFLYVAAQLLGAGAFGGIAMMFEGDLPGGSIGYPKVALDHKGTAVLCEIILSFALCHTILHVATSANQANNSYFGVAIGSVVLSGAISVGGLSGGAFNPAMSVLTMIKGDWGSVWVYWVGPLIGGAIAGFVFRIIHPGQCRGGICFCTPYPDDGAEPAVYGKYIMEFIGTFLLAFTVGVAAAPANPNENDMIGVSVGAMLMTQVFTGGATSGANYNPSVSLGLLVRMYTGGVGPACQKMRDTFNWVLCSYYIAIQITAGFAAGGCATLIMHTLDSDKAGFVTTTSGFPYPTTSVEKAFVIEFICTFILVLIVLNTATTACTSGNGYFGYAIGLVVGSMAIATGGIAGGCFNPAVAVIALTSRTDMSNGSLNKLWVYFVAPPLAGLFAGLVFRVQNYGEFTGCSLDDGHQQFNRHASVHDVKQGEYTNHVYHTSYNAFMPGGKGLQLTDAELSQTAHARGLRAEAEAHEAVVKNSAGAAPLGRQLTDMVGITDPNDVEASGERERCVC